MGGWARSTLRLTRLSKFEKVSSQPSLLASAVTIYLDKSLDSHSS